MSRNASVPTSASVHVENIGGIDEAEVDLSPGITALIGANATNRTSLMQAVAGALGSEHVTLKSDAQRGEATLVFDGETYSRRLERENGRVEVSGDPYLDDSELADLYAVLLGDNEVRRAVRRGEDLRDLIMRPVDTEQIRRDIARLVDERQEIDAELDRLDVLAEELPDLEAERRRLRTELDDVEERLETKRAALQEAEADGEREPGVEEALDGKLEALREARTELETVEENLSIERKSLESLREEHASVEEQYESLSVPDEERLAAAEERLASLRERKQSIESTISELQRIAQFNDEQLDGAGRSLLDSVGNGASEVTDELDPDGATTTCWTCGSEVRRSRIEETVDRLRELRREKSAERARVADEIDDLREEVEDLEARRDEHDRLAARLDELAADLDRREATVESLEERRATLEERVDDLESDVEALQDAQQDELLALQQQVSELTFERDRVADRLADVEAEIEEIEAELDTREDLVARRDAVSEDLTELRTRIERKENEAVVAFNTHMEAILDRLGYDNIERIWIEATETEVTDGQRTVTEQTFDLHIVRQSESGAAYEDSIEHLSESEREVVGLVVALAGYIVHGVGETVPFMLLDSLEMIDGERLARLVDYLKEHVPFLVVVLLPDHAAAFDSPSAPDHARITDI